MADQVSPPATPFADRTVLVTGSTRGIGYAIAKHLAQLGSRVIVNGRSRQSSEDASARIVLDGGRSMALVADVSDPAAVAMMLEEATARMWMPDVLVNNAAISGPDSVAHFLQLDVAQWDRTIDTNLKGTYLCSHWLANRWLDQSVRGSIVNISSYSAQRSHRNAAAYDASKGGVDALTRAMAIDLAPFDIRVNAVAPGRIDVDEHSLLDPGARRERGAFVPLGRTGQPEDIAGAVAFLVSDSAAYVTGQVLVVDGGVLAQLRTPKDDRTIPASLRERFARRAIAADRPQG